jgi:CheY-like chemotaxis protein
LRRFSRKEEPVERLRAGESFDVILCDLMMPAMSGPQFYAAIEPALQHKVIFITGGAFTPEAKAFRAAHAGQTLEKPLDMERLREVIRTISNS